MAECQTNALKTCPVSWLRDYSRTDRDVSGPEVWNLIIGWMDDDVERDCRGLLSPVGHEQHELVGGGLHPLVSRLDIVNVSIQHVTVGERG